MFQYITYTNTINIKFNIHPTYGPQLKTIHTNANNPNRRPSNHPAVVLVRNITTKSQQSHWPLHSRDKNNMLVLFQLCFNCVWMIFKWCVNNLFVMFQGCFKHVLVTCKGCVSDDWMMFQWCVGDVSQCFTMYNVLGMITGWLGDG